MFGKKPRQKVVVELVYEDPVDVRVFAFGSGIARAYIGTESGPGSEELQFYIPADMAERAKPYIHQGILYGTMIAKAWVL
jgi:hypothetical protein